MTGVSAYKATSTLLSGSTRTLKNDPVRVLLMLGRDWYDWFPNVGVDGVCATLGVLPRVGDGMLSAAGGVFENCSDATTHSGETDEANCTWLHPVWLPPKRPDQDSTFCAVSRASTGLIFCIHRDFDVRNNVCKPRRLVCENCRDISA